MGARMTDINLLIQAGFDPKTGLPLKMTEGSACELKSNIKRCLRVRDEQDAVNRYKWYNLPCNISSQELERLIYYKGQLCFFYFEPLDQFFFMPYALDGTIDFYGRFNTIHPVPMTSGTTEEEKKIYKQQSDLLSTLRLKVYYDIPLDFIDYETFTKSTVLLHDYTKQLSQSIIPRQQLQEGILDVMSDCLPYVRTSLKNSTGVQGMRVLNEDEQSNVKAANLSIDAAALNGQRYVPIVGQVDFQDLAGGNVAQSQEFLMSMQAIDNFRKSLYGIENGGLWDKSSYVNKDQTALNGGNVDSPLVDGLLIRQRFCDIVNGIWGLGISCELDESTANADTNMDGIISSDNDQSGLPGDQQEVPNDM